MAKEKKKISALKTQTKKGRINNHVHVNIITTMLNLENIFVNSVQEWENLTKREI